VDDPPDDTPFVFDTVGEGELPTSINGMSYFHDGERVEIGKKDLIRYLNEEGELIGAAYPDENGEPAYVLSGRDGRKVIVRGKISSQTELDNGVFPEGITLYDSEDGTIVWSKGAGGDEADANDVHNEGFGKPPSGRYDFKNAQPQGNPS
jgi:hypothetical protein|tara:strand:- start:441 stop:890 length:450 start_codon:yes stop_codon:yes gene_type:complete